MTEEAEVAVVVIAFIKGIREDDGSIQAEGTSVAWGTEDMSSARTLREQLCGLLGDPVGEQILPLIDAELLKSFESQWPGAVKLGEQWDAQ